MTAYPDGAPYQAGGPSGWQVLCPDGLSYDGRSVRTQGLPPGRPVRMGGPTVMTAYPDGMLYHADGPSRWQVLRPDSLS